jgi:hypothetical protein
VGKTAAENVLRVQKFSALYLLELHAATAVERERLVQGRQHKKRQTRAERAQRRKDERAVVRCDTAALYASVLFEPVATMVGYCRPCSNSPHVSSELPVVNDDDDLSVTLQRTKPGHLLSS